MEAHKSQHVSSPGCPPSAISSVSLSAEIERDAYKEKIEHFKVLIRQLQQEIQSSKIRKEGAETVSKLLHEARQEVALLQRKQKTYESVIRTLQNRLEANGLSCEVTLQEGESFVPGPSKQLLDNLTRENTRLRGLVRSANVDPEEVQRIQQALGSNEQQMTQYKQHIQTLEDKISELERVLRLSDSEKDTTINDLRQEIQRLQSEKQSKETMCMSLTEETTTLRSQLEEVAQRCRQLALKLEEVQTAEKRTTDVTESPTKAELQLLKDENDGLKVNVSEITEMNKRWQDYNNQRENYVRHLQVTVKDLQERLGNAQAGTASSDIMQDMQRQVNKVLDESKREVQKITRERDQLKRDLEQSSQQVIRLAEENQRLMSRHVQQSTEKHDMETINALKAQIQICTEDFESERRDREKAQSKISQLETDLEQMRRENDRLRKSHHAQPEMYNQPPNIAPQYNDPFYHYQMPGVHGNFGSDTTLAARGVSNINKYNVIDGNVVDGARNMMYDTEEDSEQTHVVQLDTSKLHEQYTMPRNQSPISLPAQPLRTSPKPSPPSPRTIAEATDVLKCPKCGKEFPPEKHTDLLDHIEVCCD